VQEDQWHVTKVQHLSKGGVGEDVRKDPHGHHPGFRLFRYIIHYVLQVLEKKYFKNTGRLKEKGDLHMGVSF